MAAIVISTQIQCRPVLHQLVIGIVRQTVEKKMSFIHTVNLYFYSVITAILLFHLITNLHTVHTDSGKYPEILFYCWLVMAKWMDTTTEE